LTVGIEKEYLPGCLDRRFGDGDRYHLTPPKDIAMRVPDEIRKSVLFIGTLENPDDPKWRATGYFLAVPDSIISGNTTVGQFLVTHSYPFRFLATARHVAEQLEGEDFVLRVNKRDGGVAIIHGHADTKWWYHPTDKEHVDAALTLFQPSELEGFDIFTVHLNLFADEQRIGELDIGPGDEVFIAGLFTKITTTAQNVPIVRIGNLAMMPGERIPFKDGKLIDAYLIESRSLGGLSGSPVFVRETIKMQPSSSSGRLFSGKRQLPSTEKVMLDAVGRIYFLGSVIGHWDAPTGLDVPEQELVNMGISPIVPAQKIKEILTQPELLDMVKKVKEGIAAKNHVGAVEDFAAGGHKETTIEKTKTFTKEDFETALKKASRKKT
jgi:hypothetical protein